MLILSYSDKPLFREALILDIKYHGLLKAFFLFRFFASPSLRTPAGGEFCAVSEFCVVSENDSDILKTWPFGEVR